ncbi:glycosyltransferase [Caproiciproducens sp. MSJ-32]|uniref:glycosyltransferase n=1 Tax=Caproiciproducens sp. MSJ-32 TaxID=2841527 RepID=UPI001C128216|nr:glycosyltransferase [Caproiciproducens sp. MSJ-32]MBU5456190.1 glycosyltransferase [Caproiciproducens sp. MSJ-32]
MKILFIACYSPLINNSASIETLQYLNNLANIKDNEIHLLTVNFPKNSIYYDEYIFNMLDKKVKIHIISGGKIFEKVMPKRSNNINININNKLSLKNKILRRIKKVIAVPDMYYYWSIKASKYGIKLMEKENFDVMFSMHEPPSSHICAYYIKKKYKNLKWITYWSDPWTKDSTRENINILRRKFEESYERKVVELSDKFIFVTKENRDDYIGTYNIEKDNTFIITRGYDEELYKEIALEEKPELINDKKINIVYAGEIFTKLRDIRPFIEALEKLKKENIDFFNKLNILFFGNIDDENIKSKLSLIGNVKVSNRIPYKKALSYMINSDLLILFGNKNSKQIPAKIYDYFGCNAYILVILGDSKDPIKSVIENKEKCIVVMNKKDEIRNSLIEICGKINNGIKSFPINEYEWKNISHKLFKILKGE